MIRDYLHQTAVLNRSTGISGDGTRTTGAIPILCRFQYGTKHFTNAKGELVTGVATIFTETPVLPTDTVTYDGHTWPVQRVLERRGFETVSHYEVLI